MSKSELILEKKFHYCPGCTHTSAHHIMANLIDELGIAEKAIAIAPVGCSVLAHNYIDIDWLEPAHGRAPACSLGIKAVHPESVVICYQGDGDLASIGLNETIHTAARGTNITVIFINNGIYGMTGGQMSPTTIPNMVTTTTPKGRDTDTMGYPLDVCKLMNQLERPQLIARTHISSADGKRETEALLREALTNQIENKGYSFIEILAVCPTAWRMTVKESNDYIKEQISDLFPCKVFRRDGEVLA